MAHVACQTFLTAELHLFSLWCFVWVLIFSFCLKIHGPCRFLVHVSLQTIQQMLLLVELSQFFEQPSITNPSLKIESGMCRHSTFQQKNWGLNSEPRPLNPRPMVSGIKEAKPRTMPRKYINIAANKIQGHRPRFSKLLVALYSVLYHVMQCWCNCNWCPLNKQSKLN